MYDVLDHASIHAPPSEVFRALIDQASGRAPWWPGVVSRTRGRIPPDEVGGLTEAKVHGWLMVRFVTRVTAVQRDRFIHTEYVAGDFRGRSSWRLEPEGRDTRLCLRWRASLHQPLFQLLCPFVDFGREHSNVTRVGFSRLDEYVRAQAVTRCGARGKW